MLKNILFIYFCVISSGALAAAVPIRYVALGDSYTVGTGAGLGESWPAVMTARLYHKGVPIDLVADLGHNGWTSQNLIDGELPQLEQLKPDFVTLLIGANDCFQGVDAEVFQKNVEYILGELLKTLPDPKHILIVTIPDFSVTPTGKRFSHGRDTAQAIKDFNEILIQEAQAHHIKTADLYALSQNMGHDTSLIAQDGLHPSSKEYAIWAGQIEPAVRSLYAGFDH